MPDQRSSSPPAVPAPHLALGRWGERLAARRYRRDGYRIVERNWRGRAGEVDLVLVGRGAVVFCEVKTRSTDAFGGAVGAVDRRRRERLRLAALEFLAGPGRHLAHLGVRFDVVAIQPGSHQRIEAAF